MQCFILSLLIVSFKPFFFFIVLVIVLVSFIIVVIVIVIFVVVLVIVIVVDVSAAFLLLLYAFSLHYSFSFSIVISILISSELGCFVPKSSTSRYAFNCVLSPQPHSLGWTSRYLITDAFAVNKFNCLH